MAASAKKYKLFSAAGSNERPPCAFFASPEGCRNGDGCKFAHHDSNQHNSKAVDHHPYHHERSSLTAALLIGTDKNHRIPALHASPGSVVSSESSTGEIVERNNGGPPRKAPAGTQAVNKAVSDEDAQQQNPNTTQDSTSKKKRKKRRGKKDADNDNPFAVPKKKAKVDSEPPKDISQPAKTPEVSAAPLKSTGSKGQKIAPTTNRNPPTTAVADFRSLNLPVTPFSVPGAGQVESRIEEKEATTPPKPVTAATPTYPLPKSTEAGRKWLGLVEQTRRHARFQGAYDLPKFKTFDEEIGYGKGLWIKPKPFGEWCRDFPQVIALDCEMCETQDPVSGCKDPRALCRISIIDAEKGELLLDSLVKPNWPVVNHRTFVNGIAEEHLENVKFTLRHAQAFLMALCSEETVLLGHALQNDLAAMKMEHYCVVDSACLFEAKDNPDATVSLKDLAGSILKKVMPDQHDSVNDASTALDCIKHYWERQGKVEKIERSVSTRPNYGAQLFIHRIPKNCEDSHIAQMFLRHTGVQPSEVDFIAFSGDIGKTIAHFQSTRHANLAFDTLEGKAEVEASGRLQKKVYLRAGGYVRVRKMAFEKPKTQDGNKQSLSLVVGTPVDPKVN